MRIATFILSCLILPVVFGQRGQFRPRAGQRESAVLPPSEPEPRDPLAQVDCEISEDGYLVPDPDQCDRFVECTPHGRKSIQLCTDGFGLDLQTGKCDLMSKVDCTGREKLQEPTGSGLCPRLNGNFPLPADKSCSEFVDCREGQPFMQSCGYGAVFDSVLGCVHPDETNRQGCTASDVFGFKCPEFNTDLMFGDHERLAHPTDCAYFYACLSSGQPRLLGCEKPKVFNPDSGLCEKQEDVEGCEDYYPPEELDQDLQIERERIEEEIRAELEAKFGLSTGSLSSEPASIDTGSTSRFASPSSPASGGSQSSTGASSRGSPAFRGLFSRPRN